MASVRLRTCGGAVLFAALAAATAGAASRSDAIRVSATVVPSCRISANAARGAAPSAAPVTVVCTRSAERTLTVSISEVRPAAIHADAPADPATLVLLEF